MKKLLFVLFLSISSVIHANWKLIHNSDTGEFYIDVSSIHSISNLKRAWHKVHYANNIEGMFSSLSLMEFDCKERKVRRLTFDAFKQLNLIDKFESSQLPGEWFFVRPNSISLDMLNFVCKK